MIGQSKMKIAAISVMLFLLTGNHDSPVHGSDESVEELYQQGNDALAENRNQVAIDYFARVAVYRPHDVELYYWLGVAHWGGDDAQGAMEAYRRAIAEDPEATSLWSLYALENLAEVYTRTDHLQESKAAYQRALKREIRPEWIDKIRNQLAELDLTMGSFEPDENSVFNERGEVVGGVGPGLMRTNRNFEIARHTNDPRKEEKYYRLAIETDPGMYQSYFNLGLALVRQDRFAEAIPWFEKSDKVWKRDSDWNPIGIDKADAHAFLARCHLEMGNLRQAESHADLALAADSSLFWTRLYVSRVKIATGQAQEALEALQNLVEANPEHGEVLAALAEARAALGG